MVENTVVARSRNTPPPISSPSKQGSEYDFENWDGSGCPPLKHAARTGEVEAYNAGYQAGTDSEADVRLRQIEAHKIRAEDTPA